MAINTEDDNDQHEEWDPFEWKAERAELRRFRLLQQFHTTAVNNGGDLRDTTMVFLVLKCNLILADAQYMAILGLIPGYNEHVELYALLVRDVRYVATHLKKQVMAVSLADMPLTDVRRLCYRVADKYDSLFYVPTKTSEDCELHSALSFQWLDRYNSMWPIVSMMNREFQRVDPTIRVARGASG